MVLIARPSIEDPTLMCQGAMLQGPWENTLGKHTGKETHREETHRDGGGNRCVISWA